ncbi:MAG: metallophosphoesterase, partial [Pseudonocardia sp.]|nr:metallophosphoesterase [Pseudonocardia sp.]
MLKDLLDKDKTLDLAAEVRSAATPTFRRRLSVDPRVWLGTLALRRSIATERKTIERTGGPTPMDRKSYLPRDLVLSFFQARQDERAATAVKNEHTVTGVKFAEGASLGRGFDYHWVTEFLRELTTHLVRRMLFRLVREAPRIVSVAPDARIILVGDWGTGEGVALEVAARMREQIDAAGEREVHVVHLGDVYYAGTRWEARHRFLDHWPVRPEEAGRVRSWCLNGNHDMYSAGEGLFEVILADGRFDDQRTEHGRVTSEFHLRNDHWDVVGLDTSWKFRLTDVRGGAGH